MEYYSTIKKNKILQVITRWRDTESIMLSEISQKEKDKYCMFSLIKQTSEYQIMLNKFFTNIFNTNTEHTKRTIISATKLA